MTQTVLAAKRRAREQREREKMEQIFNPLVDFHEEEEGPGEEDVDVEFLRMISGRSLAEGDYGIGFDLSGLPEGQVPTDRDIEHYEHLRDLFWWNCKMDVYQSILGATRLL